ncbi:Toxin protein Tse4 [Pseudomonas soli]
MLLSIWTQGLASVEWRCHYTEVHMQITLPLSVSDWEYKSASGGGLTVMFAAASGGLLTLTDPDKAEQQFRYGSLGVGVGAGARLPRVGKINLLVRGKSVGAAGTNADLPAIGTVLVTDSVASRGLVRDDFRGGCVFLEGGLGLVGGGSGSGVLFGLDPKLLALGTAAIGAGGAFLPQDTFPRLLRSAKGVILSAGFNIGVQAGGGLALTLGGLY